jgi:hypothetical protein
MALLDGESNAIPVVSALVPNVVSRPRTVGNLVKYRNPSSVAHNAHNNNLVPLSRLSLSMISDAMSVASRSFMADLWEELLTDTIPEWSLMAVKKTNLVVDCRSNSDTSFSAGDLPVPSST